jgi:ribosomal protection tetracycline resistance protein
MRTLNLGILAHVDAGKTTLTERLLYSAGVIDEIGSVDDGTTQTDTLDLERQRGITIKSAVVSFAIGDATINLIDTPGHPDFIAEVERALSVLDGAVLVLSAVEGVQSQTRVLWRALQRLGIPTVFFVNKLDRAGADPDRVVMAIGENLTASIVPMQSVHGAGTRAAGVTPEAPNRPQPTVVPILFGSAVTGAGVEELMAAIPELLPAVERRTDGDPAGTIFKVERGPGGGTVAYVRMVSGTARIRDRLHVGEDADERTVTGIEVFGNGSVGRSRAVAAGQIGRLWGLGDVRIGEAIGGTEGVNAHHFAPPTLETVVVARDPADKIRLHTALAQLAEQDPLINLRQDDERNELFVSLYGEVQKEVIGATLAADFGVEVDFRESTTIHVERPIGVGAAVEAMKQPGNPFLATVGLRVEPATIGSGLRYERAREVHGRMPAAFFQAVEDTVRQTLREGLHGWQVTDCTVTLTDADYLGKHGLGRQDFNKSMSSTGADYRGLTPLVLMAALHQARTSVMEPMHRFSLEVPDDSLGAVMPHLTRHRGLVLEQEVRGTTCVIGGNLPAGSIHALHQLLPSLTGGEALFESAFDHYRPVSGPIPTRPRTGLDPLDRKEYLLRVLRRV